MSKSVMDIELQNGLSAINYTTEEAVKEFVILNLSDKIAKFKSECAFYSNKHCMNFSKFEKKIENRTNEENFEEYNDYMAWKFAEEQKECLSKQLEVIK